MADENLKTYVVLAGAVTIQTGRIDPQTKKPEVVRLLNGTELNAPEDNPSVQTLLSIRAIAPKGKVKKGARVTARHIFTVFQRAGEDAMAPVVEAVKPLPAPITASGTPEGSITES